MEKWRAVGKSNASTTNWSKGRTSETSSVTCNLDGRNVVVGIERASNMGKKAATNLLLAP